MEGERRWREVESGAGVDIITKCLILAPPPLKKQKNLLLFWTFQVISKLFFFEKVVLVGFWAPTPLWGPTTKIYMSA